MKYAANAVKTLPALAAAAMVMACAAFAQTERQTTPDDKGLAQAVAEAKDIRDIKGAVYFPSRLGIILAALGIAAAGGIVYAAVRYVKKRGRILPAPRPKEPHELAYERLEALRGKGYIRDGRVKEFFFELSLIVRYYLEGRFGVKAPEMTTEEFLAKLRDTTELERESKKLLREFLAYCDLVKFAKYGPSEDDIEASYASAKKLVDRTKPAPRGEGEKTAKG